MQRFIIPDEDLLALDGMPGLPESVQNAVDEVKKSRPVAVELPYDFVEDMTSRAERIHATLNDLIVSFCRRWISVNGNATTVVPMSEETAADNDRCAHLDCSHRKDVWLSPIILSEQEEPHTPAQSVKDDTRHALAKLMKEREISSAEFAWYVGVSPHTIAKFIRGGNIGEALCNNINEVIKRIESGELKTNSAVAECVIPERITKYKKSHNMSNSDIGALIGYSDTTVHRLVHGMPVSNPVYRKVRDSFKI